MSKVIVELTELESILDSRPDRVIRELGASIEITIKYIIKTCLEELDQQDVKELKLIEQKLISKPKNISSNVKSYTNLPFVDLIDLWNQAKIPYKWSKIRKTTPGAFKANQFDELRSIYNNKKHGFNEGSTTSSVIIIPPTTLKRIYYWAIDFVTQAHENDTVHYIEESNRSVDTPLSNLPNLDCDFIGRDPQKKKILDWLSSNNRHFLISVTGIGGVGKSTLALEIAHICLEESKKKHKSDRPDLQFDLIVWTSAKKRILIDNTVNDTIYSQSNLQDIVSEIIRLTDKGTHKQFPDLNRQISIVNDLLNKYRALIIVDNMETIHDEKVITFLHGLPSPSKAIITDKRSVQSSLPIRLRELSDKESFKMIVDLINNQKIQLSDDQITDLGNKTGGIPLAIRWTVGQMSKSGGSPEIVLRKLADIGNSPVLDFLFDESFNQISAYSRKVLTAISIPDSPVKGRYITEWTQLGENDVLDALMELRQYALISDNNCSQVDEISNLCITNLDDMYTVLPLTKIYLQQSQPEFELKLRKTIVRCLLDCLICKEPNPDWPSIDTINYIDDNFKLYSWAIEESHNIDEHEIAVDLMRYVGYALSIRDHNADRLRLAKIALSSAILIDDTHQAVRILIKEIAWLNFTWYKFDECIAAINEAFKYSNIDELLKAIGMRNLGLIEKELGNYEVAEQALNNALDVFVEKSDVYFQAITYGSIGSLNRDQDKLIDALKNYFKASCLLEQVDNSEELLSIQYQRISSIYVKMGQLSEASEFNSKAELILTKLKRYKGRAYCKLNQARILNMSGDQSSAMHYAEEAYELFTIYGAKEDVTDELNSLRNYTGD